MSKDLKTGMIIGVVLLIAATLMISFLSKGSLRSRLKGKFDKGTTETLPDDSNKEQNSADKKNTDDETTQSTVKIHIVTDGETINEIAEKYYDNRMMINKIVDENPQIPDDYKLKAGMKLKIPE